METTREQKYGRILAIANVLGRHVGLEIAAKHITDLGKNPRRTLERIHFDLIERAARFGESEMTLFDMMGEIIATLDVDQDFTSIPLAPNYLHEFHRKQYELYNVMGTSEASLKWGLAQDYVKRLCREGKVKAYKVGRDWKIDRDQPTPKKKEKEPE